MASARLIEPADMAGVWLVSASEGLSCPIRFTAKPEQNGYAFTAEAGCLARIGLPVVAFWRASSDGIGFANGDGQTVAFFSRETPDRFGWHRPRGPGLTLIREAATH